MEDDEDVVRKMLENQERALAQSKEAGESSEGQMEALFGLLQSMSDKRERATPRTDAAGRLSTLLRYRETFPDRESEALLAAIHEDAEVLVAEALEDMNRRNEAAEALDAAELATKAGT